MGRRTTKAGREARALKARARRAEERTRTVLKTAPKDADDRELVDAPRGYAFAALGGGRAHLMEVGISSTLCGVVASEAMRYAPQRTPGGKDCPRCFKVWRSRERYGHPPDLEAKAQRLEDIYLERTALAAAAEA